MLFFIALKQNIQPNEKKPHLRVDFYKKLYIIESRKEGEVELESEVPVCKSKSLLRIFLARVNSGYSIRRKKVGIYNSKLEVTNPKWNLQNQID